VGKHDLTAVSTVGSLASQVAQILDDTTRRLGGAPPLSPASDAIDGVTASANALVNAIGTYSADNWTEDRGGAQALDVLRAGISEAGTLVRRAEALSGD
jgi:hypothetical protein